jgi:protein phosphatase
MPPPANDPSISKAGGLWARLRGAFQPPSANEVVPTLDNVPEATPVPDEVPVATPVPADPLPDAVIPDASSAAVPIRMTDRSTEDYFVPTLEPPSVELCGCCKTPRVGDALFCFDCGMMFPEQAPSPVASAAPSADASAPSGPLAHRYELAERVCARGDLERWRGWDRGQGDLPVAVTIVRIPCAPPSDNNVLLQPAEGGDLHAAHQPPAEGPATSSSSRPPTDLPTAWPGIGWEWAVLNRIDHPSIPDVLDHFHEGRHYYLVEEAPAGVVLWDAWEDPALRPSQRFDALAQLAEGLKALHDAGAILEGLRPDIITFTPDGRACLNDLSDLLPLPVSADAPIQATSYTAPELVLDREHADARADLYSFGAMLYALHFGRELTELDYVCQGVPKPFVERDPDVHPALARVVMKTFVREKEGRFPTEEAVKEDPSGFAELAQALRAAGRSMSLARLDIASWTTTGKIRTGNEDAFALLHAAASRQEGLGERALLILADGMGGAEAGEVASAMAIEHLRNFLLRDRLFAPVTDDPLSGPEEFDPKVCQELLVNALVDTNRHIFTASRAGVGKRGMGCTAEVLYLDGERVVVGHVGDSRTYHYSGGQLIQITRDQTLVNRLVELGHLSPEEAENHPRKNELQQAVGGQPHVEPLVYHAPVRPGDWILVCSDGLTNHVEPTMLAEMIQRADSAEMLARRLCNLANLQGGSDNCTVIAVRAT